jgi:hypothetical protein
MLHLAKAAASIVKGRAPLRRGVNWSGVGRHFALSLVAASMAACGSESTAAPTDAAVGRPETSRAQDVPPGSGAPTGASSREDGAAIMRAAGFTNPHGDNQWAYGEDGCDSVWAEVEEVRDINGDGRPDAIVTANDDECLGMNQRVVILLTQGTNGWAVVTDFQQRFAVHGFYPRPGIAWPDIEIFDGMTGEQKPGGDIEASGCERFLRWNGREYIDGGTSQNGDVCELTAQGRAAATAGAPTRAAAVAFPPIEKGYYAIGVSCAQAIADDGDLLAYLDERRFASFDGGQRIEGFDALGGERYRIRGVDLTIALDGHGGFSSVEYGDRYTHCATARVPRAIREEWGDLSRR